MTGQGQRVVAARQHTSALAHMDTAKATKASLVRRRKITWTLLLLGISGMISGCILQIEVFDDLWQQIAAAALLAIAALPLLFWHVTTFDRRERLASEQEDYWRERSEAIAQWVIDDFTRQHGGSSAQSDVSGL